MGELRELMQRRASMVDELKGLVTAAEAENRDLNEQERERYDALMSGIDELRSRIERLQRLDVLERTLEASQGRMTSGHEPVTQVGMSADETRHYSIMRALFAAASGDWNLAPLERDANVEIAKRLGREPEPLRVFVPWEWQTRALVVGTASAGGDLVGEEPINFVEILRNRPMVAQAGATVLTGLVGDLPITRQTGSPTLYWQSETGGPVTQTDASFTQVTMSPQTAIGSTQYSRKLLRQSTPDLERFVANDLAMVLTLGVDLAALHGSGSGSEPTGIANTTGVGLVEGGTDGAAPTWDHIVDLETEVAIDNADVGRLAYMTNAKVRGKLKKTFVDPGSGERVWDVRAGNTPLNGYRALVTNQVRSDLTKGSGTGLSAIFFGNWADLLIGYWGVMELIVDPYTNARSGMINVTIQHEVDIAVRHPESFAVMLDALTA